MESGFWKFVVKNLLVAILVIVLLLLCLFIWLERYTQHGVEVEVPNVVGIYLEEAVPQMESRGLKLTLLDSTYTDKVPLGAIVEQTPLGNTHAKPGREVFVIINARCRQRVAIPDVHDQSPRQVESILATIGIKVSPNYVFQPSAYPGSVLDVRMGDSRLEAGDKIEVGSVVTLVVGADIGTEMKDVPNLIGKTLSEARIILLDRNLTLGGVYYDNEENEEAQVIYQQSPDAGQRLIEGGVVNVKLSSNIEKTISGGGQENEEDFF